MADFLTEARALYPFLPEGLLNLFQQKYVEFDKNVDLAVGAIRQDPQYIDYFPGNVRPDGSVRLSEAEYGAVLESYKDDLRRFGINPDVFADNFGQLVEGDVSPTEFQSRLNTVYSGVEQNIPEVKEYYATNFGIDLSEESIFAAAVDPTVGDAILSGQITQAQIGGEAEARGLAISQTQIERLQRFGVTQQQARETFRVAEQQIEELQELEAQRGVSEEERLGLQEFTEAAVFGEQEDIQRITKLREQQASEFAPTTGAARTGRRFTGLTEI
jgi:hypothetical protein